MSIFYVVFCVIVFSYRCGGSDCSVLFVLGFVLMFCFWLFVCVFRDCWDMVFVVSVLSALWCVLVVIYVALLLCGGFWLRRLRLGGCGFVIAWWFAELVWCLF